MLNQVKNHLVQRAGIYIQLGSKNGLLRLLRTLARLFLRHEFGINQQAVLEVVDSKSRSFAEANGTEVSGNFGAAFVRSSDRRRQLRRSNEHVGLEVIHALVQPEGHGLG